MGEKHKIISGEKISYSGLFELSEVLSLINSYMREVGYDKKVRWSDQNTVDNKKLISLKLKPWKTVSDYIKFEIEMVINADVEDVEVKIHGKNKIVQKGKFSISFSASVLTDYAGEWENKAEYFFLRTVFNKFMYKMKFTEWDNLLKTQVQHLKTEVSSFLNMKRFHDYEVHTMRDTLR